MRKPIISFLLLLAFFTSFTFAEEKEKKEELLNSSILNGLKIRNIGPALTSGRISDFAVNPANHAEYYVAVASGNLWKTTDHGATFEPVFDGEGSYSIGDVTMDPNNTNVIWVGTGENNSQRSVAYGDGVYLSVDGGKSWKNVGLEKSEHIGRIIIDPRDSKVVYVAAQGPLWGPGGDRGLYKTTDMGETWEKVLEISENTGVSDIAFEPGNPDVIYASAYQRRRHVFTLINGGPESALYKSTDAGKTWNKLTSGLPGGDKGRIGISVSPADPAYVYAIVESTNKKSGFYRSTNKGATWEKRSDYIASSPQYYMEIYCDPVNKDKVFSLDTYSRYTLDGGKTFKRISTKSRHVDDHALWIDPVHTNHFLIGGDGGVYETYNGGDTFEFIDNLPVIQFYKVAVDNALPFYHVHGGTQDNNSMGGPSRTVSGSGIFNSDWYITNGGDGFEAACDPDDPNIVYYQSQYGWLVRYDKRTGEKIGIKPQEKIGADPLRWNWDSPLIVSPHKGQRLYFAANKLFKSEDRGNSWEVISPDLSRNLDRNKLEVMGKVWSVDAVSKNASTSLYGNIVALDESPIKEGLLYTGSDDGLIHVSQDGGKNWKKIEGIDNLFERIYVNDLVASQHKESRVYAVFNNHKYNDFKPYVYVSEDAGNSWKSITSNLPERGSVYAIAEDHVNENLLFAGTEFGLFFSPDRGENWYQLKAGLPTIAIRDLEIQRRENDLVMASFGRGFYVLDNFTPLRGITKKTVKDEFILFPVKDAPVYQQNYQYGGGKKGSQGDGFYVADNPEFGATFTFYMKESISTLKSERRKEEKELIKNEKPVPFPTNDELIAEDYEEKPFLIFTVKDTKGNVVRRLKASASKGVNRLTWDLRTSAWFPVGETEGLLSNKDNGILVVPGKYVVSVAKSVNGEVSDMGYSTEFNVVPLENGYYKTGDAKELYEFQSEFVNLYASAVSANSFINTQVKNLKEIRSSLKQAPGATYEMMAEAKAVYDSVVALDVELNGEPSFSKRNMNQPKTIMDHLGTVMYEQYRTLDAPTTTHKEMTADVRANLTQLINNLRSLSENEIAALEETLNKIGAPYTKGRLPMMK